jgi:hypothetical protein
MKDQRHRSDLFLYVVLIFCVFSFKFIVLGVNESGVRVDDPIIFLVFLLLLFRGDFLQVRRSRPFNLYLIFVGVSFASTAWSAWNGRVDWLYSTLFVARLVQYQIFYYIGYAVAKAGFDFGRILKVYLATLCVLVPLQSLHILPIPNAFTAERASGNTNGPYEMAAVAAFLLCYLGFRNKQRLSGAAAVVLMIWTAARSTFAGAAISLGKILYRQSRPLKIKFALLAGVGFLAVASLWTMGFQFGSSDAGSKAGFFERLSSSASVGTVSDAIAVYNASPSYQNSEQYSNGAFLYAIAAATQNQGDTSGLMRIFRWTALLKSAFAHPDTVIIGLGPSFGTSAVDGYYVRVFVETGAAGLVVFLWFLYSFLSPRGGSPWQLREYVFILAATGLFIDIFTSYKGMLLLWVWHGMNEFQASQSTEGNLAVDAG